MPIYKTNVKKDGLQQYRVRVNYTDNHGKAHSLTRLAYGLSEAKQMEQDLSSEYANGKISTANMTIAELCKMYLSSTKNTVKETTWAKKNTNIRVGVLPILGNVKLQKLTTAVLQNWKDEINNRNLSIGTKRNYYKELNGSLNYAVKLDFIDSNPLKKLGGFKDVYFTNPQETLHYYTAEEFLKYITFAKAFALISDKFSDWAYYVFFCIAFYTGMRKGEINALRWSDIDNNIIHVRRSVSQKVKGKPIFEAIPKNRSSYRDLQMPNPLKRILDEHKERQKCDTRFTEDYRVCGGIDVLKDTTIELRNKKYHTAAGLPHIRIHDFRHTHASVLINEGINIQEIARRLGHSNTEITWKIYAHLYPREEERAVKILNKIF